MTTAFKSKSNCPYRETDVATAAMFLSQGFFREFPIVGDMRLDDMSDTFGGHVGVTQEIAKYAAPVADYMESVTCEDWPGVFHYEVTEDMGAWLAHQRLECTVADFKTELALRGGIWFDPYPAPAQTPENPAQSDLVNSNTELVGMLRDLTAKVHRAGQTEHSSDRVILRLAAWRSDAILNRLAPTEQPQHTYKILPWRTSDSNGEEIEGEQCSHEDADFWSVYLRCNYFEDFGDPSGAWVADFGAQEEAERYVKLMTKPLATETAEHP